MKSIPCDLIIPCGVGVLLLVVAGVQYRLGKVYTRGDRGIKWHDKLLVSREEAPYHFWTIIILQFLIGMALALIYGIATHRSLA